MNLRSLLIFSSILLVFPSAQSWASGSVEMIRQRQMIEQEAYQRAVVEEYVRRQQAAMIQEYQAAYQQAAIQQYVEAQKQAYAVAAVQQQMAAQYMAQEMVKERAAYQAAVIQRQQALAQQEVLRFRVVQNTQYQQALMAHQMRQYVQQNAAAQVVAAAQQQRLAEYRQALVEKAVADKVAYQQAAVMKGAQEAQQMAAYQAANIYQQFDENRMYEDIPPSFVKDIVGVSDLWKSLDNSSHDWRLIIDKKAKGVTLKHYMDELAKEGAVINKDPLHYAKMIDDMSRENPRMLDQPLKDILRVVAIIEYDYNNGTDKDVMARKIFPDEKSFQANKKRLSQ